MLAEIAREPEDANAAVARLECEEEIAVTRQKPRIVADQHDLLEPDGYARRKPDVAGDGEHFLDNTAQGLSTAEHGDDHADALLERADCPARGLASFVPQSHHTASLSAQAREGNRLWR